MDYSLKEFNQALLVAHRIAWKLEESGFGWISRSHTTEVGWWRPAVTVAKHWMVRFALTPLPTGASFPAATLPHSRCRIKTHRCNRGHCCGAPREISQPLPAPCRLLRRKPELQLSDGTQGWCLCSCCKETQGAKFWALLSLIGHIFVLLQTHKLGNVCDRRVSMLRRLKERQNFIQSSQQLQTWVLFSKNQNWRNTSPREHS